MDQKRNSRPAPTWIRTVMAVGILLVVSGVGGLLHGAHQKAGAIDCLTGASPPTHWEFDQRGSAGLRELLGERGSLMFLDSPTEVSCSLFTADQARALHNLPTLREVQILSTPREHVRLLHGLTHVRRLTLASDVPPEEVAELHATMPQCDIIYWYWDGPDTTQFQFPAE